MQLFLLDPDPCRVNADPKHCYTHKNIGNVPGQSMTELLGSLRVVPLVSAGVRPAETTTDRGSCCCSCCCSPCSSRCCRSFWYDSGSRNSWPATNSLKILYQTTDCIQERYRYGTKIYFQQANKSFKSGLWIPIDLLPIRIQHFCSIRIRIQAKPELLKTISFSNFFEIKIRVKSNQKYLLKIT
jgi:hypothetical protein